jgi:hypothetical protein
VEGITMEMEYRRREASAKPSAPLWESTLYLASLTDITLTLISAFTKPPIFLLCAHMQNVFNLNC